jgi:hypothetical protein
VKSFFFSSLPLFLLSSHNSRECVTTAQLLRKCYTQWVCFDSPLHFFFFFFPTAPELLYNMDLFSASIWPIRISLFQISSPRPNLCIN